MNEVEGIAALPVPSLLVSPDGRIAACNDAAGSALGSPAARWVGAPVEMIVVESDREWFGNRLREFLSAEEESGSYPRMGVNLLPNGGQDYPVETLLVRTELTDAPVLMMILPVGPNEEGPADPEAWTRITALSLDRLGDAVFWTDPEARFCRVNEAACTALGYRRLELMRMSLLDIETDLRPEGWAERWRELKRRRSFAFESAFRRKDGSSFPVEVTVNHVEFRQRHYNCIVARDLTGRKQLEQQFLQAQKMEAVGRLAGGLAHDFNNLMTVILGYSELLLSRVQPADPVSKELTEIANAAKRATDLNKQLLAFSRRQMLHPIVLNLNNTVHNTARIITRLIGEDVEMATELSRDLGNVRADPAQIEHVLFNLAVNARDAMPGGGRLTIRTADVELDQEYALAHGVRLETGPYVMLAVSDTGVGMDRATLSRIFEPFFTTKELGKGTGLGLSTVYGVVKQSGGYIGAESDPRRGTTFRIYLPRADAPLQEPGSLQEPPRLVGTEMVLLVEDDEQLLRLARESLQSYGYRVLESRNAEEAIGQCANRHGEIDILVTDVVLPSWTGPRLAAALSRMVPGLKVLYLSGYSDELLLEHGFPDAASRLLKKPFTPAELARRVRQTLDQKSGA